jgi:hypothetical protein
MRRLWHLHSNDGMEGVKDKAHFFQSLEQGLEGSLKGVGDFIFRCKFTT